MEIAVVADRIQNGRLINFHLRYKYKIISITMIPLTWFLFLFHGLTFSYFPTDFISNIFGLGVYGIWFWAKLNHSVDTLCTCSALCTSLYTWPLPGTSLSCYDISVKIHGTPRLLDQVFILYAIMSVPY